MLHARDDYSRIQDPAANPELLAAYNEAMHEVAFSSKHAMPSLGEHRVLVVALSRLCRALTPTLGDLVTASGVHVPPNPIRDDEPVFLLRGQDLHAPDTIRRWAGLTHDRGNGNQEAAELASNHADAMERWQQETGRVKVADLPDQRASHPTRMRSGSDSGASHG